LVAVESAPENAETFRSEARRDADAGIKALEGVNVGVSMAFVIRRVGFIEADRCTTRDGTGGCRLSTRDTLVTSLGLGVKTTLLEALDGEQFCCNPPNSVVRILPADMGDTCNTH
jgi:hypothetical protein